MNQLDKEATQLAKRLGAKHVTIIAVFKNDIQYGGNTPAIIDETGGKNGANKRLTFLMPTE